MYIIYEYTHILSFETELLEDKDFILVWKVE